MVWSSWGKSWGGGEGTSETIIVDSFNLEVSVEQVIFEEPQEFEIIMDAQEFSIEQEEQVIVSEVQEFVLELEVE
jgi:hypothetical protein